MYDYMHEECDDINWSQLKTVQPAESARALFQLITQEVTLAQKLTFKKLFQNTEKYNGKHIDYHEVSSVA